ncbi:TylF/MycF family methyltransferase [Caulobacter endophyticus]|uniref:TylF/MycF family methyltransferase n=1 Tax=Caulobacter endophyticus TaxID=2172652 RepID=UPI001E57110C|nr:TylF/MycF family methyltransferase [Caulobacter endophyticus]
MAELYPDAKVYALDTYEGMPTVDEQYDMVEAGRFQVEGGIEGIRAYASSLGLKNIEFVQGLFQDTLPPLLATGVKFGLAHVDADIYSACKYAQDTVWPSLVKGAYITYDDPLDSTNMGAMQALEEMIVERDIRTEQMFPHPVLRAHL